MRREIVVQYFFLVLSVRFECKQCSLCTKFNRIHYGAKEKCADRMKSYRRTKYEEVFNKCGLCVCVPLNEILYWNSFRNKLAKYCVPFFVCFFLFILQSQINFEVTHYAGHRQTNAAQSIRLFLAGADRWLDICCCEHLRFCHSKKCDSQTKTKNTHTHRKSSNMQMLMTHRKTFPTLFSLIYIYT